LALVGIGWPKLALVGVGWHWLALVGVGWRWLALVGVGWHWLALVGIGWCWLALVGTDWHWLVLVGVGWREKSSILIKFGQTSLSTIPKGTESDSMYSCQMMLFENLTFPRWTKMVVCTLINQILHFYFSFAFLLPQL
jgi:hypothetical protein